MPSISASVVALAIVVGATCASAGNSYAQSGGPPMNPDRIIREQAQPVGPPILNGPPMNPARILRDQQQPSPMVLTPVR